MRNSYLIVGAIVLVAILGFLLASKKTEAPVDKEVDTEKTSKTANQSLIDGVYKLDTQTSLITWEGEQLTGIKERGSIKLLSGEVTVVNGMVASGEFMIDMNSLESEPHKEMLVNHLKSQDFFEVSKYPTSKFVLKSSVPTSARGALEGRFVFAGNLTIKGIVKPISFTANLSGEEDNLKAEASFAINRADWEVKYNSPTFFSNLGDKLIRDAVTIGLDLKAQRVIQ